MSQLWVYVETLGDAGVVTLSAEEGRHVAARRLRAGDPVVAFDGRGSTAAARIESIGKRAALIRIDRVERAPEPTDAWILATAIPKGDRLATMLSMLIQLGVPVWQPLVLEDSAVRDLDVRSPRLQRILVEGAKLARRAWLLEARDPCGLDVLLAGAPSGGGLCFGDREGEGVGIPPGASVVVIGPEAGLTAGEAARLRAAGGLACALGSHNMRIETAAAAAAAARFVACEKGRSVRDG